MSLNNLNRERQSKLLSSQRRQQQKTDVENRELSNLQKKNGFETVGDEKSEIELLTRNISRSNEKDTKMVEQVFMKVKNIELPLGHEDGYDVDGLIRIVEEVKNLTQDRENKDDLAQDPVVQQMLVNILTKNYDVHQANLRKKGQAAPLFEVDQEKLIDLLIKTCQALSNFTTDFKVCKSILDQYLNLIEVLTDLLKKYFQTNYLQIDVVIKQSDQTKFNKRISLMKEIIYLQNRLVDCSLKQLKIKSNENVAPDFLRNTDEFYYQLLENYYLANLYIGQNTFDHSFWTAFVQFFSLYSCTLEYRSDYELANLQTNQYLKKFLNMYLEKALGSYVGNEEVANSQMHKDLYRLINNQCKYMKPVCVQDMFAKDMQARKFVLKNIEECKYALRYCLDDTNKLEVLKSYKGANLQILVHFIDDEGSLIHLYENLYDKVKISLFSKNVKVLKIALEIVYKWTMRSLLDDIQAQEVIHYLLYKNHAEFLQYEIKIFKKVLFDGKNLTPVLYKSIHEIAKAVLAQKDFVSFEIQNDCKIIQEMLNQIHKGPFDPEQQKETDTQHQGCVPLVI